MSYVSPQLSTIVSLPPDVTFVPYDPANEALSPPITSHTGTNAMARTLSTGIVRRMTATSIVKMDIFKV